MANSYVEYVGDGIQDAFQIPFGFLRNTHIIAQLNAVEVDTFSISGSTLTFDTAPSDSVAIKILRATPREPIHEYKDGSSPTADQLNETALQALYVSQELEDGTISGSPVIENNSLTLAKLVQIPQNQILGRASSGTGDVESLTASQVRTAAGLAATSTSTCLVAANNLSDLTSASTARTNLGLATIASTGQYVNLLTKPQEYQTEKKTTDSTSSGTFAAISGFSVAITPRSNTSKVRVQAVMKFGTNSSGSAGHYRLMRGSTPINVGTPTGSQDACTGSIAAQLDTKTYCEVIDFLDEPASASEVTYSVQWRATAGTCYLNRSGNDSGSSAPATSSTISVKEIIYTL